MLGIRIEPSLDGKRLRVDVTCDCGNNVLINPLTQISHHRHVIPTTGMGMHTETTLVCTVCGKKYGLDSHGNHGHVTSL